MRLIDADKLRTIWIENREGFCTLAVLADDINNAPTVDAVPVVRCKDCRWCKTSRTTHPECQLHCEWVVSGYYCASGEVAGGAK